MTREVEIKEMIVDLKRLIATNEEEEEAEEEKKAEKRRIERANNELKSEEAIKAEKLPRFS